jgi:large subunit ribosomal protein L5
MVQKLDTLYKTEVKPSLQKTFEYSNEMTVPKIVKVQVNRGLGLSASNSKMLKKTVDEFRQITGQQPVVTLAKKSIAGFKIREEMPLGVTVTLRKQKMYSFLERLINLALPRIRDFQGLDPKKFDKYGNYTFGILDQLMFPEIEYDQVDQTLGLNITIVTTANNPEEGLELLKQMGLPFKK